MITQVIDTKLKQVNVRASQFPGGITVEVYNDGCLSDQLILELSAEQFHHLADKIYEVFPVEKPVELKVVGR